MMQDEYTGSRVAERLRSAIDNRSSSLAHFARSSGIPYRSLQDYTAGKSKPGLDQLIKLSAAGLDLNYILTGFPTGSVDHPSPDGIEPLYLTAELSMPGRHFLHGTIDSIAARGGQGLDLRAWMEVWTAAEDEVMSAEDAGALPHRRQAVVFAFAAEIARGVKERLQATGLIGLPPG